MLIVIGTGRPLPERREEFLRAAQAMAEATRGDAGCLSYGFLGSIDDDTVVSLEVWTDRAALDAHLEHPHTRDFLSHAARLTDGTSDLAVYDAHRTDHPAQSADAG
ncbi:putative quinol monooxygenase [Actinomadura opuntiae]|uniref:putative quinol monooxygenase n=1 Tax=Actinomadura sp. OS1-43 TaxID=604315 RepID=UPI00255AF2EF|nr:putative quinol monooxygenase [Actinomadura sp. OS1-43]MDL4817278.1 putative quinol monooxygenase [Actinomadura sp. OS1-43]